MQWDNLHTRFVTMSKVLLPLLAVTLLSTLFLFARRPIGESEIPYAQIEEMAQGQRMTAPNYAGVTRDGIAVTLSAESMKPTPGQTESGVITGIRATLDAPDGTKVLVSAGQGQIDGAAKTAVLTGLARIETNSGFVMETSGVSADLGTGVLESLGPLEVRAPFGQVTANHVILRTDPEGQNQQMVFNGGIRLLYLPPN